MGPFFPATLLCLFFITLPFTSSPEANSFYILNICSGHELSKKMSTYNDSVGDVDIIFAGGGTAACVAASRLAKANPNLKILLVEGGKNNFNDPTVVNPAVYLSHLA